ncbi:MAG: nucleoside triphosphate pyrophosphohydrolase [Pseudomonadota bacterium]
MTPSRDISALLEIMAALRTPKTGCPWDLEQDFASIAPYTLEEAYEVVDAIEKNDMEDLRLELGDLLLQSVYHSQMAKEAGHFDFGDVVESITTKMIRRHPHVFGTEDVTAEEYSAKGMAKGTWERIKAEEKAEAAERRSKLGLPSKAQSTSILESVPNTHPALVVGVKLQKKAAQVGFDWDNVSAVFEKIREELAELETEIEAGDTQSANGEIGDLLFAIANLARHLDIDPEFALRETNRKFRNRFGYIEEQLTGNNQEISNSNLEEMESLWQEAKTKGL